MTTADRLALIKGADGKINYEQFRGVGRGAVGP